MKFKILILLSAVIMSVNSHSAGFIVEGATLTHVANTSGNSNQFRITYSGGTETIVCNLDRISFPIWGAGNDKEIHNRAYSAALAALTTGATVNVYSYSDTVSCNNASFIEINAR